MSSRWPPFLSDELAARTGKQVEVSEIPLEEIWQTPPLAEDLNRPRVEEGRGKMAAGAGRNAPVAGERAVTYRQYLVRLDLSRLQQNNKLIKLQAMQERIREEACIHANMDVMQLVRAHFHAPNETDEEVSLKISVLFGYLLTALADPSFLSTQRP